MKSMIVSMMLVCAIVFCMSCEDDSSSSSSKNDSGSIIEFTCEVIGASEYVGSSTNVLKAYDCSGNKKVLYTTSTSALRQRDSCSGFDSATPNDISIGDILIVEYNSEEVDWATSPVSMFAVKITAYRSSCVSGSPSNVGDEGSGCSPCDFFN